jgi:hypothetical protein
VDNLWSDSVSAISGNPRNNAGLGMGGILTGEGGSARRFAGDLVEVRFYDTRLSGPEITSVVQELQSLHISSGSPIILDFSASPVQILLHTPATLTWETTNAQTLSIDAGVGSVSMDAGSLLVFPQTNTTYNLTASNAVGVRTRQATVQASRPPIPNGSPLS